MAPSSLQPEVPNDHGVSVVIPAFNEVQGIERCLNETVAAMRQSGRPFEVILVDDGSDDSTADRAVELARGTPEVRVLSANENAGKGAALMHGALQARHELVLFVDADLEIHPRQFAVLYERMRAESADIVIGSKMHPDSVVDYPTERRILSLGYYALVRALFRLPVRDTQTGLKLYRREILQDVIPRLLCKRFAMDLELLSTAHRLGAKIVEAPVVVTRERDFPRIGGADVRNVMQDTAAIWYRTYILRHYDRPVVRWQELTPTPVSTEATTTTPVDAPPADEPAVPHGSTAP